MSGDLDPVSASAVRVSVACAAHFILLWFGLPAARAHHSLTLRVLAQTALNGFIAMGVGMVAILSSVSPVLLLPLLWLRLGRAPAPGAWVGAGLTVLGTALILLR